MSKEEEIKEEIKEQVEEEVEPNYKLLITTSTFIFPLLYAYSKGNTCL